MKKNYMLKPLLILFMCIASFISAFCEIGENIEDYGADGTDSDCDQEAIMDAIDAAMATNGSKVVIIPKGTFYLDEAITLTGSSYNRLTIKGIGQASILSHRTGDNAIELGESGTTLYITLKDFKIVNTNSSANAGISVKNSNKSQFLNLYILGYGSTSSGSDSEGGACMKFKNSNTQTVRECFLLSSNYGIYLRSGDTVENLNVVDCIIENIGQTGIYLQAGKGVKINGCCIEGGTMEYGVYANHGESYSINNCYFEGITESCIYLENSAYLKGVTISGCYMMITYTDYAININGVQGAMISGNSFYSIPLGGAIIKSRGGWYARDVWIIGNAHSVSSSQTLWDGYDYFDIDAAIGTGMWEDRQNKTITYGTGITFQQAQ